MADTVIETLRLSAPAVIAHGGAGRIAAEKLPERVEFMLGAAREAMTVLTRGANSDGVRDAVLHLNRAMEDHPGFNAGRGSKLQRDGKIRTSAALMDGRRTRMAGVYNADGCLHPVDLCMHLLGIDDRNVDGHGAGLIMKELGIAPENLEIPERREEFEKRKQGQTGTVGAVAVGVPDASGQPEIWACTSTGGRGYEFPGRVSDTPTPAGNYACPVVAISATGIGESILDFNVCGRLATRMIDGMELREALARTFREIDGTVIGLIAVTRDGEIGWARNTDAMPVVAIDATGKEVTAT